MDTKRNHNKNSHQKNSIRESSKNEIENICGGDAAKVFFGVALTILGSATSTVGTFFVSPHSEQKICCSIRLDIFLGTA